MGLQFLCLDFAAGLDRKNKPPQCDNSRRRRNLRGETGLRRRKAARRMEKKQGFFSVLREEVARGLSPSRSRGRPRSESPRRSTLPVAELFLFSRRWKRRGIAGELAVPRSGSLTPLMEGPEHATGEDAKKERGWGQWVKDQLSRAPSASPSASSFRRSDLRMLLGVMAAPLAPIHACSIDPLPHLSIKDTPIVRISSFSDLLHLLTRFVLVENSSAQYILQQYIAASGGFKLLSSIRNTYSMGKVRMVATEFETATRITKNRNATRDAESGGFVLWQMAPEMWYVELSVGGNKVHAGCNSKLVWHHTAWLGAHVAKGPVRPLRRALQGLDPLTTASMFANARCIGEKEVNGEDCFILKLCADPDTLRSRSEGASEVIRHVLFGYFSQKTGLLLHIEDSHLTRIQPTVGGDAVYWETSINSFLDDYRPVEGMMIAHSGHSVVTLFRFGEVAMSHSKTRMEEAWTIEEVAFNVAGLSADCFIPPADIKRESISEACELPQRERGKNIVISSHRAKIAALGSPMMMPTVKT
ncbi:hypothetical protein ZIOFF_007000 [Zingiber officinale]|uniref:Uncharacterized protein n=1 Tax=Zingiber officinale TaxID=94328 RepID=A0A8J5I0G9_ZINOF|nr:hypothetical protein ZIOFF_007000 [Zingiber officinale]